MIIIERRENKLAKFTLLGLMKKQELANGDSVYKCTISGTIQALS